jgi:hypothetical protein
MSGQLQHFTPWAMQNRKVKITSVCHKWTNRVRNKGSLLASATKLIRPIAIISEMQMFACSAIYAITEVFASQVKEGLFAWKYYKPTYLE